MSGKTVPAKTLCADSCGKCRFKCSSKLNEDERLDIFNSYWNWQSYERQRDFIAAHALIGSPSIKWKQIARAFTLNVRGQKHRVCKNFFASTLGIGRKTIEIALRKNRSPIRDKRGQHIPHNKTPSEDCEQWTVHKKNVWIIQNRLQRKQQEICNRKNL